VKAEPRSFAADAASGREEPRDQRSCRGFDRGGFSLVTTPLSDTRSWAWVGCWSSRSPSCSPLPSFRHPRHSGTQHRPPQVARPSARPVPRADRLGALGALELGHRPWARGGGRRDRDRAAHLPLSQIRSGFQPPTGFRRNPIGPGPPALREMGASGVIQPVRVVVQLPEGESALSLAAFRDQGSHRLDPEGPTRARVRGVAQAGMSTLSSLSITDVAYAPRNRSSSTRISSTAIRVTLLDVIPADTVSPGPDGRGTTGARPGGP